MEGLRPPVEKGLCSNWQWLSNYSVLTSFSNITILRFSWSVPLEFPQSSQFCRNDLQPKVRSFGVSVMIHRQNIFMQHLQQCIHSKDDIVCIFSTMVIKLFCINFFLKHHNIEVFLVCPTGISTVHEIHALWHKLYLYLSGSQQCIHSKDDIVCIFSSPC
jgi:hypothetical protein